MPIRSEDFFLVASQLPEGTELYDRSAVSRLYYGAFHQAIEFLRERHGLTDVRPGRDATTGRFIGSHQVAANLLSGVDQLAARALVRLRLRRVTADYDLGAQWDERWRAEAFELVNYLRGRFRSR